MTAPAREKKVVLKLPEQYQKLKSMHGDPPMSVPYGYMTEAMESFLLVSPVRPDHAMRRVRVFRHRLLTMHLETEGPVMQIHGFFSEGHIAGARDAMVYAMLANRGEVRLCEGGIEGWTSDPYDPFFTFGVLMNRSEQAQYDNLFPRHPLSELRRFVRKVVVEN